MFFDTPTELIETAKTTRIGYSAGKIFALILFFFLGTLFVASMSINIWNEFGHFSPLIVPLFFLTVFGGGLISHVIRFVRLNRPLLEIGPEGVLDSRYLHKPIPWAHVSTIRTRGWGRAKYVVIAVGKNPAPELRWPGRWLRPFRKVLGSGDLVIDVNGLAISQPDLFDLLVTYAQTYGAPAARDWS